MRVWFGRHTGHWWAMLGDRLLEADCPRQLADGIRAVLGAAGPAEWPLAERVRQAGISSPTRGPGRVGGHSGYVR